MRAKKGQLSDQSRPDFEVVLASTLTLLGLIIGFTFSMATTRYDQRKNYEEEEANAIGTEYLRANLLPASDAVKVQHLLIGYLDQRILFYKTRRASQLQKINADTAQLQDQLWAAVQAPATAQPTPVIALVVSGMNDVLNSQGYTQAAWWNRIPYAAWGLLGAIAMSASAMMGYSIRNVKAAITLFILPLTVSISFLLISDIDSPRGGIIRVNPRNLMSLSQSLNNH
ncbi:hypothetical protein [Acidobacterium sp. S8]|uniref:bestrophin-like domain n=1 Tax=Acidobacterium sp. S8 TaxID=1641854 RepID=UPI0020B116F3|nr:hypothetical protein [Acidobacterium sp. S8]